ncbi:transglycosylase SLT domain-containing protein [Kovacikia minuta CCNUW1]|uniref:lytic transglycosylase domain-containing protein n=1 Tax=Kovacikia minuta TaxID=2931930 RepID=UPI001CCAF691|nr:transglycosylase SLT domain-containing protein [Kovacikia minuta]UBF25524.1 transglycosylase SLT domain-containing protein [Kovacikia minuta CCNUW1]
MLKQRRAKVFMMAAGVSALLLGSGFSLIGLLEQGVRSPDSGGDSGQPVPIKQINSLKSLPTAQRKAKLEKIAKSKESSESNRARYLLANELLQQKQGQKALEQLQGLDDSYTVLSAYVLQKQAQAYELTGNQAKAQATWQELLKRHPKSPVAAEALVALGKAQPEYLGQAIDQFPAYPRTIEIVQKQLKQNPNQPKLMLVLARHALYIQAYTAVLDRLVNEYAAQLTPTDWEAIAFGYWEKQQYGKAGAAYARAPYNPRNAYRIARGLQLGEREGAVQAYQRLVNDFPKAQETSLALLRLSRLTAPDKAIAYLDQLISQFPVKAGEALLEKAKLYEKANSTKTANQIRQVLLTHFSKSDAAAEARWSFAQQLATANDWQQARQWADQILTHNPNSELAPEAGFWTGKWASKLGKSSEAQQAFKQVLSRYPQSYYAWRSASLLGWQVGDFATVRQLNPDVKRPDSRPDLPVGSATLKELYQLGQDRDAWSLWQAEFQDPMQPTVAEQFTDGVMRLGVGDYLDGIFMVSYLSERENPNEQSEYRALKQQLPYWQALYPFPFLEPIETWSQERQLNPLLVTALIRQESRFMPGIESSAGAKGLMQVMPDTGEWIAKQIKLKQYQLNDPDDNIKLGTWYLDYTHQRYGGNSMLAVASYNAGPNAVAGWVEKKGLGDPDEFVESIPYEETRGYVKSVFENYWNYMRLYNPEISDRVAQISKEHPDEERSDS